MNTDRENELALREVVKAARAIARECLSDGKIVRNPPARELLNLDDALANLDRLNP